MNTALLIAQARKMINAYIRAEFDPALSDGDAQLLRNERMVLQVTVKSGNARHIAEQLVEATRVAKMWGVAQ
jgi:hypothetical protein